MSRREQARLFALHTNPFSPHRMFIWSLDYWNFVTEYYFRIFWNILGTLPVNWNWRSRPAQHHRRVRGIHHSIPGSQHEPQAAGPLSWSQIGQKVKKCKCYVRLLWIKLKFYSLQNRRAVRGSISRNFCRQPVSTWIAPRCSWCKYLILFVSQCFTLARILWLETTSFSDPKRWQHD